MMVLHFSMQEEYIIKHTIGQCMCSHFSMQGENIVELTIAKCDMCTLLVNS